MAAFKRRPQLLRISLYPIHAVFYSRARLHVPVVAFRIMPLQGVLRGVVQTVLRALEGEQECFCFDNRILVSFLIGGYAISFQCQLNENETEPMCIRMRGR